MRPGTRGARRPPWARFRGAASATRGSTTPLVSDLSGFSSGVPLSFTASHHCGCTRALCRHRSCTRVPCGYRGCTCVLVCSIYDILRKKGINRPEKLRVCTRRARSALSVFPSGLCSWEWGWGGGGAAGRSRAQSPPRGIWAAVTKEVSPRWARREHLPQWERGHGHLVRGQTGPLGAQHPAPHPGPTCLCSPNTCDPTVLPPPGLPRAARAGPCL